MKRVFVKNLLLLQLLNLIIKPVWLLLIDRTAQNLLGEQYGQYYIVLNLALILNIVLDLGIQNFNQTHVASDPQFFKQKFKSILLLKGVLSSIYIVLVTLVGLGSDLNMTWLFLILLNQVLLTFVLYFRSNINGLHHYALDAFLSVSDKFFGILMCLIAYACNWISIEAFILIQLLATLITLILTWVINQKYYRQLPVVESLSVAWNLKGIWPLLKLSLPFALLFTLMNMYTRLDVAMMNLLLPNANYHSGIYAQSFRLLDATAMFAMLFAGLLLPMFSKLIQDKADPKPLTHLASTILLVISISIGLASYLYAYRIVDLLYDFKSIDQAIESSAVFQNILMSFIPMSVTFVFSTLLTAQKDLYHLNVFAGIALVLNVILNACFIPIWQSWGASLSTLITQSVFALLCYWRCKQLFGFKIQTTEGLKFAVFVVILIGFFVVLKGIGSTVISLLLFGISAVLLCLALKIIHPQQVYNFLRSKTQ
jgi:O-antigen/teichoic acid export membrane protein